MFCNRLGCVVNKEEIKEEGIPKYIKKAERSIVVDIDTQSKVTEEACQKQQNSEDYTDEVLFDILLVSQ